MRDDAPRFKSRAIYRSCTKWNYWNTPHWELVDRGILEGSHDDGAAVGDTLADKQCKGCCEDCPEDGATCISEGVTFEALPLNKDWWCATDVTTVLYSCTLTKACRGVSAAACELGNVSLCHKGHNGATQPEYLNLASRKGAHAVS